MAFGRLGRQNAVEVDDAWPRAVHRLTRAVHRYQEVVGQIPDRQLRRELLRFGRSLESALADVEAASTHPRLRAGRDQEALRAVGRAATVTSHATEQALASAEARRGQDSIGLTRALDQVRAHVTEVGVLATTVAHPGVTHPGINGQGG